MGVSQWLPTLAFPMTTRSELLRVAPSQGVCSNLLDGSKAEAVPQGCRLSHQTSFLRGLTVLLIFCCVHISLQTHVPTFWCHENKTLSTLSHRLCEVGRFTLAESCTCQSFVTCPWRQPTSEVCYIETVVSWMSQDNCLELFVRDARIKYLFKKINCRNHRRMSSVLKACSHFQCTWFR